MKKILIILASVMIFGIMADAKTTKKSASKRKGSTASAVTITKGEIC